MLTTPHAALPLAVSDGRLITSAIAGFAVIILLITWLKVNPFVALTIGSIAVGLATGLEPAKALTSCTTGFGSTMGTSGWSSSTWAPRWARPSRPGASWSA